MASSGVISTKDEKKRCILDPSVSIYRGLELNTYSRAMLSAFLYTLVALFLLLVIIQKNKNNPAHQIGIHKKTADLLIYNFFWYFLVPLLQKKYWLNFLKLNTFLEFNCYFNTWNWKWVSICEGVTKLLARTWEVGGSTAICS